MLNAQSDLADVVFSNKQAHETLDKKVDSKDVATMKDRLEILPTKHEVEEMRKYLKENVDRFTE